MRYGFFVTRYTSSVLVPRARDMRKSPTSTERTLWLALRSNALGVRFRRQVVLGRYIVDFFAPSARLALEVDGPVHRSRLSLDAERDLGLAKLGVRTLRFPSWRIEKQLPLVLHEIRAALSL